MRIKTRLLITTMLPLLMGIVVGGLMFFENRNDAEIKYAREGMQQVSKAIFELTLIDNERYLGETRQRATSQWRQRYKSLGLLLNHLEEYTNTEARELLIRLHQAHESVGFLFSKINEIYGKESVPFGQESSDLFVMLSEQQRSKLHEMLAHADRILESVTQHNEAQKKLIYLFIYAVIGVITLSGLLLALIINARIVQSVVKLGQVAEIIGSGVLSHRIDLPVGDEFGQLAADFNQICPLPTNTSGHRMHDRVVSGA